jgi:hypothetical protein
MAITAEEGSYTDYAYTGGVQILTIPYDGIYKLECWGPGGGYQGAKGGYAAGYKRLTKGTVVYIVCGQCGGKDGEYGNRYNGGQDGSGSTNPAHWYGKHPGAGCTHMALVSGVLSSLSSNKNKVLIVAGGGGAAATDGTYGGMGIGGDGGGLSGSSGSSSAGGSQTTGYAFGLGGPAVSQVDGDNQKAMTGGGAGWYGGYAGIKGGGGGSSYIDGCAAFTYMGKSYNPSTTTGGGSAAETNGKARVTFVRKTLLPVHFNGTQLEKIVFNGTEITGLVVDGVKLFFERLKVRFESWFTSTKTARKSRALT